MVLWVLLVLMVLISLAVFADSSQDVSLYILYNMAVKEPEGQSPWTFEFLTFSFSSKCLKISRMQA